MTGVKTQIHIAIKGTAFERNISHIGFIKAYGTRTEINQIKLRFAFSKICLVKAFAAMPETRAAERNLAIAKLGAVKAGYQQIRTETVVACGVTGDLDTYTAGGTAAGGGGGSDADGRAACGPV